VPSSAPSVCDPGRAHLAAVAGKARSALLIAYHFPPCGVSSGLQRTLCFSRDLRNHGWSPLVLTVHPRAYPAAKSDQLGQIPSAVPVRRTFALDTTRHLGFRGRYLGWMALPDPWITWLMGAIPAGLQMIRKHRPQVLWSTYPVATAHLVGMALCRLTGIPWVADFRDPMTEIDPVTQQRFPEDRRLWSVRRWIERQTLRHCSRAVFVTPGSLRIHQARYPEFADRMALIANGYDEVSFEAAESAVRMDCGGANMNRLLLLHSGVLYPGPDRDPTAFFAALVKLRQCGKLINGALQVRLRASGYEDHYKRLIQDFGVGDIVSLAPPIPYQEALAEMLTADGLLVFQGRTSNPAVPAKLYENLRARRPIFGLVDSQGETAGVLRQAGAGTLVPLDDVAMIAAGLESFLSQVRSGTAAVPGMEEVERHSRKHKAGELANLFEEVVRIRMSTRTSTGPDQRER